MHFCSRLEAAASVEEHPRRLRRVKSREDVVAAAQAHGLSAEAAFFAAIARPAWRLSLSVPGPDGVRIGASKLGGHPDMAPGESWPCNARGLPLVFLAQLAPADFPALPRSDQPWGHRGELVRLFGDLLVNPYEPGPAFGLSTTSDQLNRTVTPIQPPPEQSDDEMFGRVRELPERAVEARAILTLPAVHPAIREMPNHWIDPLSERYEKFAGAVDAERFGRCQILGWPEDGDDDPLAAGPCVEDGYNIRDWTTQPADWRLMLLVHYNSTVDGDPYESHSFYAVVIRAADLAAGRYDRLVCDVVLD